MQRKRFGQVIKCTAVLLVAGILYGAFVHRTGIGIPCMFHLITGFKCPGCGVTHMCVALLQLDFRGAYESNQMLFLLSLFLAIVFATYIAGYVRDGEWKMNRLQTGVLSVSIILLIGFGIVRNIV